MSILWETGNKSKWNLGTLNQFITNLRGKVRKKVKNNFLSEHSGVGCLQRTLTWKLALCSKNFGRKKIPKTSKMDHFLKWSNFRGCWAFSWAGCVLSKFWLHSANILVKVLLIDTPESTLLCSDKIIFHFFLTFPSLLSSQYTKSKSLNFDSPGWTKWEYAQTYL